MFSMHYKTFFTSTGVVSGTSLRIMMQRLWFGRTLSPLSSTCTMGEAVTKTQRKDSFFSPLRSNLMAPNSPTYCAVVSLALSGLDLQPFIFRVFFSNYKHCMAVQIISQCPYQHSQTLFQENYDKKQTCMANSYWLVSYTPFRVFLLGKMVNRNKLWCFSTNTHFIHLDVIVTKKWRVLTCLICSEKFIIR